MSSRGLRSTAGTAVGPAGNREPERGRRHPRAYGGPAEYDDPDGLWAESVQEFEWLDGPETSDVISGAAVSNELNRERVLEALLRAGETSSTAVALRQVLGACMNHWGAQTALAVLITGHTSIGRLLVACRAERGGAQEDMLLAAELSGIPDGALDRVVRERFASRPVYALDLVLEDGALCRLWFVLGARAPEGWEPDGWVIQAATLSLRTVHARAAAGWAGVAYEPDDWEEHRERRDAMLGRLVSDAAGSLLATQAALAVAHASIEHEIAGLRTSRPTDPAFDTCVRLLRDAWDAAWMAQQVMTVVSHVATSEGQIAQRIEPTPVIRSTWMLAAPHLQKVATVEHDVGELPSVLLVPGALAEVLLTLLLSAARSVMRDASTKSRPVIALRARECTEGVEITVSARTPVSRQRPSAVVEVLSSVPPPPSVAAVSVAQARETVTSWGGRLDARQEEGVSSWRVVIPTC